MFITWLSRCISFYREERCILNGNSQYAINLYYYQQNTPRQLLSSIACLRRERHVNACHPPHQREVIQVEANRRPLSRLMSTSVVFSSCVGNGQYDPGTWAAVKHLEIFGRMDPELLQARPWPNQVRRHDLNLNPCPQGSPQQLTATPSPPQFLCSVGAQHILME